MASVSYTFFVCSIKSSKEKGKIIMWFIGDAHNFGGGAGAYRIRTIPIMVAHIRNTSMLMLL